MLHWRLLLSGFFPPIILVNKYYIGDNVLLEPIADILAETFPAVYIYNKTPHYNDLFIEHPRIKRIYNLEEAPDDARLLDLDKAISSVELVEDDAGNVISGTISPNKLKAMYEACGIGYDRRKSPRLYLSTDEIKKARQFRRQYGSKCVTVVLRSKHEVKDWPYTYKLIKKLLKGHYNVFVLASVLLPEDSAITDLNVNLLVDLPNIREMMWKLSAMDAVIGPDTGPMHVAAALKVPVIPITRDIWTDLYEPYDRKQILSVGRYEEYSEPVDYRPYIITHPLSTISVRNVVHALDNVISSEVPSETFSPERICIRPAKTDIALFRLDGLGGTITMVDQAKKIYEMTGIKSTLVIRSYKDIFKGNPYIKDIITVGGVNWSECLGEIYRNFNVLAEERFALGKWHQKQGYEIFEQDFSELEGLFQQFPKNYRDLESYGLHHVQVTDEILGLPSDTIDMDIYNYEEPTVNLPKEFILVSNGVDAIHQGMRQTKMWDGWDDLVPLVKMPIVQVGTLKDQPILDAIDIRGKTTIPQLCSVIRDASAVVCCEGGIMHMAYAVDAKKVLIIRGPTRGKLFEYPGHKFIDSYVCTNCWSITDDWYERCPKNINVACMQTISPERVAFNIEEVLNEAVA